jgi:hypothetical protein
MGGRLDSFYGTFSSSYEDRLEDEKRLRKLKEPFFSSSFWYRAFLGIKRSLF